jgi:hypothetical protein
MRSDCLDIVFTHVIYDVCLVLISCFIPSSIRRISFEKKKPEKTKTKRGEEEEEVEKRSEQFSIVSCMRRQARILFVFIRFCSSFLCIFSSMVTSEFSREEEKQRTRKKTRSRFELDCFHQLSR